MPYLLVALSDVEPERVAVLLDGLSRRGVQIVYDGFAPTAWVVSYNGTPRQLTDLLWPDDVKEEGYAIKSGVVVRVSPATINGYTAKEFWRLFSMQED